MRLGIDLGGTKIEAIVIGDLAEEIYRKRIPTPSNDYEKILSAIAWLVFDCQSTAGGKIKTVGVGTPGAISPATGLIKNSNSVCLIGKHLDRDLKQLINLPLKIANDANCFALSEASSGAAKNASVVFGVILGTGVGAGIVVEGKVIGGANAIAGEWGHNPLPWPLESELPGPLCYCGKRGCIETFLSGPALTTDYKALTGVEITSQEIVEAALRGTAINSTEAGNNAGENSRQAKITLDRYCDRLAKSLAHVINILDPNVIVLGGGMSNVDYLYEVIPQLWTKYIFSDEVDTKLVKAQHGDSSGVRGAACLF